MTLQQKLQAREPENLRKDSDHRLVSDKGWVIFGKEKYGPQKGQDYISVMDNTDGYGVTYTFHRDGMLWDVLKQSRDGHSESEITMDDMSDVQELDKLGMNVGPLMKRAICAIAIQHDRAVRINESLMDSAMRRAGLSVSKDGKISDAGAGTIQQRGRS